MDYFDCFKYPDIKEIKPKLNFPFALHKEVSQLRTCAVNVTKPQFTADLVTFTEELLNGKLHFLCSFG